jgi:hypothetical protein
MGRILENHSMDVLSRFGLPVIPYVVAELVKKLEKHVQKWTFQ